MSIEEYLLLNSISLVVIFFTIKSNYKNTKKYKYIDIKLIGYLMFIGYGIEYVALWDNVKYSIRILILLLVLIIILCKSKSKEIFFVALQSIKTYVAVEAFVISTYVSFKFISGVKTLTHSEYIKVVIITIVFYYILEKIYYEYIFLEFLEGNIDLKINNSLVCYVKIFIDIAIVIATYVTVFFIYFYHEFIYLNNLNNLINVIVLLAFTMIILEMYLAYLINQHSKNAQLKVRAMNLEKQIEYQLKHYEEFYKFQQRTKKLMHDNKQHAELISNLIKQQEYDLSLDYINKVQNAYKINQVKEYTRNKIIDAILNSKLEECSKENIKVDIDIKIPEKTGIDKIDLCIIIGNLFDNAIEASKKVEDEARRNITITLKLVENKFIFKIVNTYDGVINVQADKILTTKGKRDEHGIGLMNVKDTVKKYNGTFNNVYNKESFEATVYIVLSKE